MSLNETPADLSTLFPPYPEPPEGMKWEYLESGFVGGLGDYCFLNSSRTEWIRAKNSGGFFSHILWAVPLGELSIGQLLNACVRSNDRATKDTGFVEIPDDHPARFGFRLKENPKESAGRKKCPMHLLPPEFLTQTANVMGEGAAKYSAWNWRETPIKLSTYIGAMMRHLTAIADGEDLDESGFPHAAHIAASVAIILDAGKHGKLIDDRPKA